MTYKTTRFTSMGLALGLALLISLSSISFGLAQDNEPYIRKITSMESDETGLLNPVGLTFSSQSENFYVVEDPGQPPSLLGNSEVIAITPLGDQEDSVRIATTIQDPLNVVFDNLNNRLLAFQPSTNQLIEVRENPSGNLDRTITISHNLGRLGIQEPQGLALDEGSGTLFILDAVGPRIVRLQLGPGRNFTGGRIGVIDLTSSGLVAPRGIAFDPTSSHLHLFDLSDQHLYELNERGQVVAARDLVHLGLRNPGSMVFAPSGDQTDDPSQMSLFLADSGLISGRGSGTRVPSSPQVQEEAGSSLSSGQIVELSLVQPAEAAASSFTSALIKTTNLSTISPPSPDPSGLAYLPAGNRLMVSDGEVEETAFQITHFQGANVWELTPAGSVIRTANISPVEPTVVPMSDEPTGVAWNPNNGHYYFSDDTGSPDVYDLNPGPDGLVGTSDDTWTGFSGSSVGLGDAEGIAYDTWNNTLFVVDGINAEVYRFTLAGTLISQFDVLKFGVVDPEAIEFNSDSGTLYVMSNDRSCPVMVETTITGVLLQTIDISSANARTAAGLAYAPASNGSGEKRFYIVDRGYDNNENGNLIDGKLYELSTPPAGPTPTPSRTFTPTNTPLPGSSPTFTPTGQPSGDSLFVSFALNGSVGGISFADEDILHFDGQNWSIVFDGSDVVSGSTDLFALSVIDSDTILMAFSSNVTLNGMAVTPQDIVRFDATSLGANTAGTFSMYFNGIDVGLDSTGEKIDALSVLPDGRVLISTTGSPSVPGVSGKDEDILAFTPTTLGSTTSGTWAMYFDGSDVGLAESSGEDIDGMDVIGGNIYLSTTGDFSVSGNAGADEDIFICMPASLGGVTTCNYNAALIFDGSTWNLADNDLDAFFLGTAGPQPSATPTATFTATNTLAPGVTPTNTPTPTSTFTPTPTFTPTNTPTSTPTGQASGNAFYASFALSGTVGSVSFADEDILYFNGQNWSMFFDGSDVGTGSVDLFAISIVDSDTVLMVFSSAVTLNGLAVTPHDIVQFDATSLGNNTAGTFSMYFNGGDVGLDDPTAEKIDAMSVLPDGRILISTTVDSSVPGVTGKDEDILAFTPNSLGANTSGTWAMYFDGSDVGLSDTTGEDIDAMDIVNGKLYLSTTADFLVNGASGAGEDVFICTPTSLGDVTACNFAASLYFDGSAWGLAGNSLDGLSFGTGSVVLSIAPALVSASTATPTNTSTSILVATSSFTPTLVPTNTAVPGIFPTITFTATPMPPSTDTVTVTATESSAIQPTEGTTTVE